MKCALLFALLLAGCSPPLSQEERAIRVAYGEARDRFHYTEDLGKLPPQTEDLGDTWRIHFQLRPERAGGAPIVDVRKSDLEVIGSVSGQ